MRIHNLQESMQNQDLISRQQQAQELPARTASAETVAMGEAFL